MARKFMRKVMVVMMDLIIIILVEVQANDLTSISFLPASLLISLPLLSKPDKVQGLVYICLDKIKP
jgi:hypothetical protein